MLMAVGTHIDLSQIKGSKKNILPVETEPSGHLYDVGTKIVFVDFLKGFDVLNITDRVLVKRLGNVAY